MRKYCQITVIDKLFNYKDDDLIMDIPRNCRKGPGCTFAHGPEDLRQQTCIFFEEGNYFKKIHTTVN